MESASAPTEKGSNATRGLAVLLFLLLLLGGAIMIIAMVDIAGTTLCSDVTRAFVVQHPNGECFDGSSLQKTIGVILGFGGGGAGLIAAVMAIAYTVTGRRGRLVLGLTGLAIVLSGLSFLVGNL